ncbi:MAG: FecR domain-containing protein [Phaeodactylibacter sp.]|nr:FecR domain-containing protein [Phaeodactylibacter sp.]
MKLEQFLADPSFENWAKRSNEADYLRWEAWRTENPAYATLMDEAKLMLTGIAFRKIEVPEQKKQEEWQALMQQLGLEGREATVRPLHRRRWWAGAAAAIMVLLAAGWWLFLRPVEPVWTTAATGFGQLRTLELPDGSAATLNANSELRYPETWKSGQTLRLELEGEAFFDVRHKKSGEAFIVSAAGVETEVLGTRFNVFARRNHPVVGLLEGSVRLTETQTGATALLEPGQSAQFDGEKNTFRIASDRATEQASWKNHRWLFDNTPLSEVLQRIEDEFGLPSRVGKESLLDRRVSGQVSTEKLAVLLQALEILLDVKIQEEGGVLKIEGR